VAYGACATLSLVAGLAMATFGCMSPACPVRALRRLLADAISEASRSQLVGDAPGLRGSGRCGACRRERQPVGGADLHHSVDAQIQELAFA
jgi:hypothetical protein